MLAKRTQIYKHFRRNQLESFFNIQRQKLLESPNALLNQLYERVRSEQTKKLNHSLINELISALNEYSQENNVYIIIGNYLWDHPDAFDNFYDLVVNTEQYITNLIWVLYLMANFLQQKIRQKKQQLQSLERLCEISDRMVYVGQLLMTKIDEGQQIKQKDFQIWQYFNEIMKIRLNYFELGFPRVMVELFCKLDGSLCFTKYYKELTYNQRKSLWMVIDLALNNSFQCQELEKDMKEQLLRAGHPHILYCLRQLPAERQNCLETLSQLPVEWVYMFSEIIMEEEFIKQLLYLLSNVNNLKTIIVKVLLQSLNELPMRKILIMLNSRVHISIVEHLSRLISSERDSKELLPCLEIINFLFIKISEKRENRILERMKNQMEQISFDKELETLAAQKNCREVDQLVNWIIDSYELETL